MNSNSPVDNSSSKLLGLELLRFTCAFAVLVFHFQHFWFVGSQSVGVNIEHMPLYQWLPLRAMYRFGYLGVSVFWSISGYIFFWKYRDAIANRKIAGRKFFMLRFSRLYPLHLATLFLVLSLQMAHLRLTSSYFVYADNSPAEFVAQLFMASNWFPWQPWSFNGPIWSVSVEVVVYLLFFFLLRYVGSDWKVVASVFFAFTLGIFITKFDYGLFYCIAFFYGGGLAALARESLEKRGYVIGAIALAVIFLVVLSAYLWAHKIYNASGFDWRQFMLICGPLIVFCVAGELGLPNRLAHLVQGLGNMTYASYLLHFPIQLFIVICCLAANISVPKESPVLLVVYVCVVLVLSPLVFRHFEIPLQSRLRQLESAPRFRIAKIDV